MLQEVGRDGPVRGPADEEGHLLAALKVVDDTGGGPGGRLAPSLELGELDGVVRVDDGGGVVPEAGGRDAGATGMPVSMMKGRRGVSFVSTHVLMLAVLNCESSLMRMGWSTPSPQHPAPPSVAWAPVTSLASAPPLSK